MKHIFRLAITVTICCGLLPAIAAADNGYDRSNAAANQYLLRVATAAREQVVAQYGLTVVGVLEGDDGLVLVEGLDSMSPQAVESLLAQDPNVGAVERARQVWIPDLGSSSSSPSDVLADLLQSGDSSAACLSQSFDLWNGYAAQEATERINLQPAQLASPDCGAATVAMIDTGIDQDHPVLAGALVLGYDFLLEEASIPSAWSLLDQSVRAILEAQGEDPGDADLGQSVRAILEMVAVESITAVAAGQGELATLGAASMAPIVDAELASEIEDQVLPPSFGHGTMVAGLIRLVAPGVEIMPLRVFDDAGTAHVFDIVRAVYWAVDHGADVINMSFTMEDSSIELREAIRYAREHGVVCVAAAGNGSEQTLVYPAGLSHSVGVASTDFDDRLSDFSNYGSQLVELAAPGAGVISAFPGGLFAAGWGTSFSTPLVAGTLALIQYLHPNPDIPDFNHKVNALAQGCESLESPGNDAGSGRLDVLATMEAAD